MSHEPTGSMTEQTASRSALGPASRPTHTAAVDIGIGPADRGVRHAGVIVDIDTLPSLLGLDVLASHRMDVDRVDIDAAGRAMRLDARSSPDAWRPLLLSSHSHPHVDVIWPSTSACAVWDTGASISVVDQELAALHPEVFAPIGTTAGTDGDGRTEATGLVSIAPCVIGGRQFAATIGAVAPIAGIQPAGDPDFTLILGYPLISQAAWAIDFPRARWGFLRD